MKNGFIRVLLFVCLSCFLVTQVSLANTKTVESRNKVKCYVDIDNGLSIISLWVIPDKKLKKFERSIVGRSVLTQSSIEESFIVKTHQCVLEDKQFTSVKARLLDEKTVR